MKILALALAFASTALASTQSWSIESSVNARLGWDSNPLGVHGSSAGLRNNDTIVSSGGGTITAKYGRTKVGYSSELIRYADAEWENCSTHRLSFAGQAKVASWQVAAEGSSLYVDGSRDTLPSSSTSNSHSISLWRERREQWQHRLKLHGQYIAGAYLLRTGLSLVACDYNTHVVSGLVAFADRLDLMATLDAGRKRSPDSLGLVGVRAGHQAQAQVPLPNCAFDYANDYARLAFGWEGRPAKETTLAITAGPDFRHYTGAIDARILNGGRDRTSLWFEGNVSSKLTARFTIAGKVVRTSWLSSTGKSALIDTCAESSATYAANPKTAFRLIAKLHRCDYFPVIRDDYESFIGPGLTHSFTARISVSVDVLRHRAWSNLDAFPERAFSRTQVTVAATLQL
jgi:hypothetical protein